MKANSSCHCGSNISFNKCYQLFIKGDQLPTTAEQLMRSRFTAFKIREHQYLINTHRSNQTIHKNEFDNNIDWLGLKIISSEDGSASNKSGYVSFVAFFKNFNDDQIEQLHEKSYFEKYDTQWLYISGTPLSKIKLNRNEPCFCGSGKKVKKCHLI